MDSVYKAERENFIYQANRKLEDGLFDEVIAMADERLSHYPGDTDAHIFIATVLVRTDKLTEAREILSKLDMMIREWSRVYELLGFVCRKQDANDAAIKAYKKYIALNSDLSIRGHLTKTNESDRDEAPEDLRLTEVSDYSWKPDLGQVPGDREEKIEMLHVKSERPEKLKTPMGKIAEGKCEIASPLPRFDTVTLAELYFQQGHQEIAKDMLNRILLKDPGNEEALDKLKKMEAVNSKKWTPAIDELNIWLKKLRRSNPV
ncbi:MAG: hypothetical protein JXB42_00365 [Deltaproteobacteria bacterium]|nr:hypothetical protein [Deltaproteobacteria bacterium]